MSSVADLYNSSSRPPKTTNCTIMSERSQQVFTLNPSTSGAQPSYAFQHTLITKQYIEKYLTQICIFVLLSTIHLSPNIFIVSRCLMYI